ncbi:MAG TPA: membrane protein insertase YidC [Bacteroidota bacterium]|nr:membrane protein insertase YidC [Bacteroidota bacterium]
MDRKSIIGFLLIGLVLMVWMYWNAPPPQPPAAQQDTSAAAAKPAVRDTLAQLPKPVQAGSADTLGKFFSPLAVGEKKTIVVETDRYRCELSTLGGRIQSWIVKGYKTWDQYPVNLVNTDSKGDFNLQFFTSDGKLVDTKGLYFTTTIPAGKAYTVGPNDSLRIDFVLPVNDQSRIVKSLVFYGGTYSFDAVYRFEHMESIISNFEYQVAWESGLRYVENNTINESNFAKASGYAGGEITDVDATKLGETVKQSLSGRVTWVAMRNKYFALAIIPREKESQGAYLEGIRRPLPDQGAKEDYSISLKMPYTGNSVEEDRFTVFLGPLDFDVVRHYNVDLEKIMSLGAAWIIRPISEYVIIPLFKFLHYFVPNYGIVLILFSFIIKVALHPLTKKSMRSMQRMQALQPMMNEIKEKYKDDPQKMNQQVMRLYKEYGVNPAGGCLPMLLQLPILYALWAVFSSTIELRQASFVLWIKDLSIPDVLVTLPFRLPLFGVNEVSGLALAMGITMFVQQKMSVKDPRQQAMVYIMPILMTLMFNNFPAGLNLYYFVFNFFSIGQQMWINKQHKNEPLRKVEPGKSGGGFISKIARNLPKTQTKR